MSSVFLFVSAFIVLLMIMTLVRVIGGPTVLDRIVGVNMIGSKTTVILLLIGLIYENMSMFVDIALAYALLNFIATLGACKFFRRSNRVFMEDEVAAEEGH